MTLRLFFGYYKYIDLYQKISILGAGAQYDTCGPRDFGLTTNIPGVYHAKVNGGVCRLFKVLQTNACLNNCHYCAFRRDRSCDRTVATADEMASAFASAHSRRLVDGLFLSSGIVGSADSTMTRMIDTVHILRLRHHYRGYIHLKIMPGSSASTIREAVKISNRISLNIESPTESDLSVLSPDKNLKTGFFSTLFEINRQIRQIKYYGLKTPGVTTQFVVGAGEESDRRLVATTHLLYQQFGLKRVFYSAFRPIPDTPLAQKSAESLTRQNRLYQADFLMRFYRFDPNEICFDNSDRLCLETDPKTLWARKHPEFFPVNITRASYWDLLRVPGLGPVTAKRIIGLRSFPHSLRLPTRSVSFICY